MRLLGPLAAALAVVAVLGLLVPLVPGAAAAPSAAPVTTPLVGNVSGPSVLPTSSNGTFYLNVSGGPAVLAGDFVGAINWTANLSGPNTTGVSVSPKNGSVTNSTTQPVALVLSTGASTETVTLTVKATSTLAKQNATANFSATFRIVPAYTVRATLVAGPNSGILPFNVTVALDGKVVTTLTIPALSPGTPYGIVYRYPSTGLGSGYHTITLAIADAHGLVTFSNGKTVESTTFYVAPAAPNNTVWYVAGVIAFFGVLFIYATRGAARRRGSTRR